MSQETQARPDAPSVWASIVCGGMAGGLAWGIRGQYGHETGAMLAGLLIGLSLTLLFCPRANSLAVARAVAWCTVAIGIGGSMTYAQTVGLTQNAPLVGNWDALRWGMLGLAIKGSIWIGFGAVFLGMGLGGVPYRSRELLLIMLLLIGVSLVGMWLVNEPFRPAEKVLPHIYFSADWRWEPDAQLKPRREDWGGLLCALLTLLAYARVARRDALAFRLGLWGMAGGAIGFPLGQCLQAFHAWNAPLFQAGFLARIDPVINWWNFMETTFGTVMGAIIGLGLWLNRRIIAVPVTEPPVSMSPLTECLTIGVHIFLLLCAEFDLVPRLGWIYDPGLFLALIPIVVIAGGRYWPYGLLFPIAIIPIAGKTLRNLGYENHAIGLIAGWVIYVAVPVAVMLSAAWILARRSKGNCEAAPFLRSGLLLATWVTFSLNFAFFRFPWPWIEWTYRTPNAIVFFLCALGLSLLAIRPVPRSTQ